MSDQLDLAPIKARYAPHHKWFLQSATETLATHGSIIPWRVLTSPDPNIRNLAYFRHGDGYVASWEERVPVLNLPCAEEIADDVRVLVKEVERLEAENAALRALLPTITKVRTLRIDDPFNKGQ